MRIAIVGSGIAGLSCAHILGPRHDVVLFEAADRAGGHANTVTVDDPIAGPIGVDTGFIVHNDRNYPLLNRLFDELAVPTQDSEMSFGVADNDPNSPHHGLAYRATNLNTLFADRRHITSRAMWRMLADIGRFYRHANRYLTTGALPHQAAPATLAVTADLTLAEFLEHGDYSRAFIDLHLIPMGAAVWSADPTSFDEFPVRSLLRFLSNHGLLGVGRRPQWRTVVGGSRRYVAALLDAFDGEVRLGTPVLGVSRVDDGCVVESGGAEHRREHFDRVVLACHSDQALELLIDPTAAEKEVLGAVRYQPNRATLHTDTSILPSARRAWAAWNYHRVAPEGGEANATLTYDLTLLQRLSGAHRYLVTLNRDEMIDPGAVIASFDYAHPVFDSAAIGAQRRFEEIDGVNHVHFCGAWWGYGFHEDGIASAVETCKRIGVRW